MIIVQNTDLRPGDVLDDARVVVAVAPTELDGWPLVAVTFENAKPVDIPANGQTCLRRRGGVPV